MRSSWALRPTRIDSLGPLWVLLTLAQAAPLAPLSLASPAHLGPTWHPGHLFSPRTRPPSPLPGDLPFARRAPPGSAPNPASPSDLRTGHPEDRAGCRGAPRAVPRAGPHVCLRRRHYGNQRPADGAAHLGDRGRHGAGRGRRRHRRAAGTEGRGRGRRAGAGPDPDGGGDMPGQGRGQAEAGPTSAPHFHRCFDPLPFFLPRISNAITRTFSASRCAPRR